MKTRKLLLILIVLLSIQCFAQQKFREKKEQIKALKVGFITNELSLTSDEAVKFWPLFNAFEEKQNEIRIQKIKAFINRMDESALNKMSDKEASALLIQMENSEEELYQNRKRFISSLRGVIPPVKIIKLKRAEENFNKKLLQRYRDNNPRR